MLRIFVMMLLLPTLLTLVSCASKKSSSRLQISEDVFVKMPNGESKSLKAGEVFEFSKDEFLIESPGKVSVLVVPLERQSQQTIDISLRKKIDWVNSDTQNYLTSELEIFLPRLEMIYRLMSQSKFDLALSETKNLQEKLPDLKFLKRIEASCLMLLNRESEAQRILESIGDTATQASGGVQ